MAFAAKRKRLGQRLRSPERSEEAERLKERTGWTCRPVRRVTKYCFSISRVQLPFILRAISEESRFIDFDLNQ